MGRGDELVVVRVIEMIARFTEVITVLVRTHTLCQQSGSQDLSGDQDRLT